MGIPGFYPWLLRNKVLYNNAISLISTLALDFNALLHPLAQKVFGTSVGNNLHEQYRDDWLLFEEELRKLLLDLVDFFQPKDWLFITVDGVAVQGKMVQQRKRRILPHEKTKTTMFDSNMITPGTDFMLRLDNALERILSEEKSKLPIMTVYSSHMEPGEGEHKIMDFYRGQKYANYAVRDGPSFMPNICNNVKAMHILVSPDLDLIMLTSIAPISQILVARATFKDNKYDLVDIDKVKSLLLDTMHNSDSITSVIDDFVLISMLIGNDFLPHHPAFINVPTTTDYLIETYNKCARSLTQNKQINWKNLAAYFALLQADESRLLAIAAQKDYVYPAVLLSSAISNGNFYIESFRQKWYERALSARNKEEYQTMLHSLQLKQTEIGYLDVRNMVYNYLSTLSWNFQYYQEGWKTVNFYWYYDNDYTPLFRDISYYLTDLLDTNKTFIITQQLQEKFRYFNNQAPTVIHQLSMVMPLGNRLWLPPIVNALMDIDSPVLDNYPVTFIKELQGVDKEHLALVILPPVNIVRIHNAITKYPNYQTELAKYYNKPAKVIIVEAAQSQQIVASISEICSLINNEKKISPVYRGREERFERTKNEKTERPEKGERTERTERFERPVKNYKVKNDKDTNFQPPLLAPILPAVPSFPQVDESRLSDEFKIYTGTFHNSINPNRGAKSESYHKNADKPAYRRSDNKEKSEYTTNRGNRGTTKGKTEYKGSYYKTNTALLSLDKLNFE